MLYVSIKSFPLLGCKGPSHTLQRALSGGEGHQLAEIKLYTKPGTATAARQAGTMICCLKCGAYAQQRCVKSAKPCLGSPIGGATNFRRIRAGLHPDYRSELRLGSVSAKQAARSAAAVRSHRARPAMLSTSPGLSLQECPRMRALRARIAAKEKAAKAASIGP